MASKSLFDAVRQNDVTLAKKLIEEGADINVQKANGDTPLNFAAFKGYWEITELLLQAKADINKPDHKGWTPLNSTAQEGHTKVVDLLLQAQAEVNIANNVGSTPLYMSSQNGHTQVVQLLLTAGANVNKATNDGVTPLLISSQNGHTQVVDQLLTAGANVNKAENDGLTPLNISASKGHPEVVELLLKAGADANKANSKGWTPLNSSANNGNPEVVELLLKAGADANKANNRGFYDDTEMKVLRFTPLMSAAQEGYVPIAKLLLQHGAELKVKSKQGNTALRLASNSGKAEMVDLLTRPHEHMAKIAKQAKGSDDQETKSKVKETLNWPEIDANKVWGDEEKQALVSTSVARLLMCGKTEFGKSSLARSLLHNIPYTAKIDDRTCVVNYHSWVISDDTTVPLFDLGGHMCYQQLAHLFHSNARNNLAVLVHQLNSPDYQTTCQWLTDLTTRSPLSNLLIALTKSDDIEEAEKLNLKHQFKQNIEPYLEKEIETLEFNIDHLEDTSKSEHISKVLEKYKDIKQGIDDDSLIHMVSCKSTDGFRPIREKILGIVSSPGCHVDLSTEAHQLYVQLGKLGLDCKKEKAVDIPTDTESELEEKPSQSPSNSGPIKKKTFLQKIFGKRSPKKTSTSQPSHPSDQSLASSSKSNTTSVVQQQQKSHTVGMQQGQSDAINKRQEQSSSVDVQQPDINKTLQFVKFEEAKEKFKRIVKKRHLSDAKITTMLKECLGLLHHHGLILWYSSSPQLEQFIFNDLHSFVEVFKSLFQHDFEKTFSFNSLSRQVKMKLLKLQIEETNYNRYIERLQDEGLLSVHVFNTFAIKHGFDSDLEGLIAVLENLNVAYLIPAQEGQQLCDQYMFFPWYIKDVKPTEEILKLLREMTASRMDQHTLHTTMTGYLPISFFHCMCVALHKLLIKQSDDQTRLVWKNGIYARINKGQLLLQHEQNHLDKDVIHIYVKNPLVVQSIPESWDMVRYCLSTIDDLTVNWWPGIVTNTYLHCPHCELTNTDENHDKWPIRQHVIKVCDVDKAPHCRRNKLHSFPSCMIYPLPTDVNKAESCVKDLEAYMKDPEKWSEEEKKGVHKTGDKNIKDEMVVYMEDTTGDITETFLLDIAKQLGDKWMYVGTNLGLILAQLQNIRHDNPHNQENMAFDMLVKWRQSNSDGDLRRLLETALQKAGLLIKSQELPKWSEEKSLQAPLKHQIDVNKAESCVNDLEAYMEDPEKWSEEEKKGVHKTGDKNIKDEMVVYMEDTGDITETFLLDIAKQLGNKWMDVGTNLGLILAELQNIQHNNPHNQENMAFDMLVKWRQSNSDGDLRRLLETALLKAGLIIRH